MFPSVLNRSVPLWLPLAAALIWLAANAMPMSGVPRPDAPQISSHQTDVRTVGAPSAPSFPWLPALAFLALAASGIAGAVLVRRSRSPGPASGQPITAQTLESSRLIVDEVASQVAALLTKSIGNHDDFAKALGGAQDKLAGVATAEQLRAIAAGLLAENQRMRHQSKGLAEELDRSRQQIVNLRDDLSTAREEGLRDSLTAIGNRRAFDKNLADAMKAAEDAETPLSIVMADIDHFKKVNDAHGHPIGDEILKIFARVLTDNVRKEDTVTRYGGEEFAVILPDTMSMSASMVAEKMRTRVEADQLKLRSGQVLKLTASFGVAQMRRGESLDALVGRADSRLYKAKHLGRNRVVTR